MMTWLNSTPETLIMIAVSAFGVFVALIILTRIIGLRSFSKMSTFDFAMTIAVGSVLAGVITSDTPSVLEGAVALTALFAIQFFVSYLRRNTDWASKLVDNEPRLLMRDGVIIKSALTKTRVTESDLIAKLREANVQNFGQVRAVVLESTGDMSVLHCSDADIEFENRLLESVKGA